MNIKELVLKFGSFHWSNPGSEKIKAGLVARGGDSCSEGRGFESQDFCCKNCNVLFEKTKNKRTRGREWPIFFKKIKAPITK